MTGTEEHHGEIRNKLVRFINPNHEILSIMARFATSWYGSLTRNHEVFKNEVFDRTIDEQRQLWVSLYIQIFSAFSITKPDEFDAKVVDVIEEHKLNNQLNYNNLAT